MLPDSSSTFAESEPALFDSETRARGATGCAAATRRRAPQPVMARAKALGFLIRPDGWGQHAEQDERPRGSTMAPYVPWGAGRAAQRVVTVPSGGARMTERSEGRQATTEQASPPRRWLERIKVNQFRSIEPGTELCFSEGLHVVLGKNATGKSTLLDLIASSLELDFDKPAFRDEPLDLEFVLRAGPFHIEATVKRGFRDGNDSAVEVKAGAKKAVTKKTGAKKVTRKDVRAPDRSLREEGRYIFRGPSGFKVTLVLTNDDLPQRTVEGVDPVQYGLEEPLGWRHQTPPLAPGLGSLYNLWFEGSLSKYPALGSLVGEDAFSIGGNDKAPVRMPESDELLNVLEGDSFEICLGKSWRTQPRLLPDNIFAALPNDGAAIDVPLALEPLLSTFIREMGFTEARMFLGPPRVEQRHGMEVFAYSSPTFTFYRDGRPARRGDQLSYGQRRLFSLGWYLVCNGDVAILDEPSNGLHESWIAFLVSQLHDRQVFLTSQNRELLDMLPFGTETELRRGFVLCESRPRLGGGEPTLHWRGLREDESALMIKALRASRLDLITDLLRALNLW